MSGDDESAGFHSSDSIEQDTIAVLYSVLNSDFVKIAVEHMDRFPNIDGHLWINDEEGSIIGDLAVQIKNIPTDQLDPPRVSIKTKTVNYVHNRTSPFLLLGIDLDDNVVYWRHINYPFVDALDLDDQTSKTIAFPEEQLIDGEDEEYIQEWQEIVEDHQTGIYHHEVDRKLRNGANPAINAQRDEFEQIHDFLDEYNRLLDYEAKVVRDVFYPGSWKVGFAYKQYANERLTYGLYTIPKDANEVQIKDVESSVLEEIESSWRVYRVTGGNKIQEQPKTYARDEVEDMVERILEEKLLEHRVDRFLAREYVFSFVDEFNFMLGVDLRDRYYLDQLKSGYYHYLQMWIEEFANEVDYNSGYIIPDGSYIDIARMKSRTLREARKTIKAAVEERVEQADRVDYMDHYVVGSRNFPVGVFPRFLDFLTKLGYDTITRPYVRAIHGPYPDAPGPIPFWDRFTAKAIRDNIEIFFENFPRVYRRLLKVNFPGLKDELELYNGYEDVVVVYDMKKRRQASLELRLFGRDDRQHHPMNVKVYHQDDPEVKHTEGRHGPVNINDKEYMPFRTTQGRGILWRYPVLKYSYNHIQSNSREYF